MLLIPLEGEQTKYWDWQKDFTLLSKEFPDVKFTISGEGEERTDIWEVHFYNGTYKHAVTSIPLPEN